MTASSKRPKSPMGLASTLTCENRFSKHWKRSSGPSPTHENRLLTIFSGEEVIMSVTTGGTELAVVISDSRGKLAQEAKEIYARIKELDFNSGKYLKTLEKPWQEFYKQKIKDTGVRAEISNAKAY